MAFNHILPHIIEIIQAYDEFITYLFWHFKTVRPRPDFSSLLTYPVIRNHQAGLACNDLILLTYSGNIKLLGQSLGSEQAAFFRTFQTPTLWHDARLWLLIQHILPIRNCQAKAWLLIQYIFPCGHLYLSWSVSHLQASSMSGRGSLTPLRLTLVQWPNLVSFSTPIFTFNGQL